MKYEKQSILDNLIFPARFPTLYLILNYSLTGQHIKLSEGLVFTNKNRLLLKHSTGNLILATHKQGCV